jgi:transcriptional regulator with XRE-family HTH domain
MKAGNELGALLSERMREQGVTPAQLARLVGVSATAVNNWTSGGKLPSLEKLPAIEEHLKLNRIQILFAMGWLPSGVSEADVTEAQLLEQFKQAGSKPEAARAFEIVSSLSDTPQIKEHAMAALEGLRLLSFSRRREEDEAEGEPKRHPAERGVPENARLPSADYPGNKDRAEDDAARREPQPDAKPKKVGKRR